ncbi:MAG: tetratricopeptide repeat protein, partial [Pyrinomonadaceae bacterium]|nr:tetratricopeptide repeat protein [Pyrinomonadaceae bacterium]
PDSVRLEAINKTLQLDFQTAAKRYRDLSEHADGTEKAIAFFDLGRAHERNLNLSEAMESYQNALAINSSFASASLRIGMLYGRQLDYKKAASYFSSAEDAFKSQRRIEGEIEVINQRAKLLSGKGDATEAIEAVKTSIDKARINEIPYQQIKCLSLLSRILRSDSRTTEARPFAEEAVSIARRFDLKAQIAESLKELGTVQFFLGKDDVAEKLFEEALSTARQSKQKLIENRVLLQLGAFYVQENKADKALKYVNQVADFFEKGGYEKDMLDVLRVRAQVYDNKGDFKTTLAIYKDLVKRADRSGNLFMKAWGKRGIGRTAANLDKLRLALPELNESYSIFNSINQSFFAGYCLLSHADVAMQLGNYQKAYFSLNLAEGIAQKHKRLIPRTNVMRARIAISERKFAEAVKIAEQIITEDPTGRLASTFEAKTIMSLGFTYLGKKPKGMRLIEETFAGKIAEDDPHAAARAHLIRAEIMLENDFAEKAKESVAKAQDVLKKLSKPSLKWRAWLFHSLAVKNLNDAGLGKESAAKADAIFSTLSQKWNSKDFSTYAERPDIKHYRKLLQKSVS